MLLELTVRFKMLRKVICVLCFTLAVINVSAQLTDKYVLALKHKNQSQFEQSLAIFKELLKSDSANAEYLHNTSYLYSKLGYSRKTEQEKMSYYKTGEYLALKTMKLHPKNAFGHYSYALALGRLNENAGNKQKINNAKAIKTACDRALSLDSKIAGCYHILGRWHRTIAGFNGFEKMMINTMFGGFPQGGSYNAALESFNKAIQLEPNQILHYYELAQTYYERDEEGDIIRAKIWAKKALELSPSPTDPDDKDTREKCNILIAKCN